MKHTHTKHGGRPSKMTRNQMKLPRYPLAVGLGFPRSIQDPDNDGDNDTGTGASMATTGGGGATA